MENKILKYNNNKGDGRCVKNNFNCTIVAIFVISDQARGRDYTEATEAAGRGWGLITAGYSV